MMKSVWRRLLRKFAEMAWFIRNRCKMWKKSGRIYVENAGSPHGEKSAKITIREVTHSETSEVETWSFLPRSCCLAAGRIFWTTCELLENYLWPGSACYRHSWHSAIASLGNETSEAIPYNSFCRSWQTFRGEPALEGKNTLPFHLLIDYLVITYRL